jgi:hypothetical protein
MLLQGIITVYCKNRPRHTSALCGENTEFLNVKSDGAYCGRWLSKFINAVNTRQCSA